MARFADPVAKARKPRKRRGLDPAVDHVISDSGIRRPTTFRKAKPMAQARRMRRAIPRTELRRFLPGAGL
jgi:hypothetical protein